jgi:hypothetical protein
VNALSRIVVSTSFALGIAACGGGGGGSDDGPAQRAASATITSDNAQTIAGAVVQASSQSELFSSLGGLATPVFTSGGQMTVSAIRSFQAKSLTVGTAAASSETISCAVSGTVTYSADVATSDTLTAGDRISFTYANCDQGEGAVLDGGFELTVRTFQGDAASGSFLMTVDLVVSDFGVLENGESATMDGDLTMTLDTRDASAFRIEVSGDTLDLAANGEFASLADFSIAVTTNTTLETSTLELDGYLMSSAFSGEVRYETTQLLEVDDSGIATAGQIRITGAEDATVTISVLGENSVQLDVDLDGDSVIDRVVMVSWTELHG